MEIMKIILSTLFFCGGLTLIYFVLKEDKKDRKRTHEVFESIRENNAIVPHELRTSKGVIHIFIKEEDMENFLSLNLKEV